MCDTNWHSNLTQTEACVQNGILNADKYIVINMPYGLYHK